jgi:RNA polymerase sigma-70 factor (ECF subfamily)
MELARAYVWTATLGGSEGSPPGYDRFLSLRDDSSASQPSRSERTRPATIIDGVSSAELVGQIRSGDHAALTAVYTRFYDPLWRFAAALTGSADDAQEATQDVFVSIWERRATFDVTGDIEAYLYAAVRYRARQIGRKVRTRDDAAAMVMAERDTMVPGLGATPASPDEVATAAEITHAVLQALEALPERTRAALFLRWEQGHTLDDIGHILGISAPAVHKLIVRAQQRLLPLLAKYRDVRGDPE